ncbi:hypothetical protein Vadar_027817 [Vaccinium darrowii]|uniref:Uncharacterized protein n=1 Tax=Vaccinium darrowii TaxID=229202 RepID=A0ACB7XLQ5_9ERIC|nr:hypothetical protein Vadar_027817 [Vaccinium darrowii]
MEMCMNGMRWGLLYILQGIKPHTFKELATRAHDMEINIANHSGGNFSTVEHNKHKNGRKSDKSYGGSTEESMTVNMVPVKILRKDKKKEEYIRDKRPTLRELQEKEKSIENKHKTYPRQVKKWQAKKNSPQLTTRDEVNDRKDKKEKLLEKSFPTPITLHDFFPERYFDDDCIQIVYMISGDEQDDISQSSTH